MSQALAGPIYDKYQQRRQAQGTSGMPRYGPQSNATGLQPGPFPNPSPSVPQPNSGPFGNTQPAGPLGGGAVAQPPPAAPLGTGGPTPDPGMGRIPPNVPPGNPDFWQDEFERTHGYPTTEHQPLAYRTPNDTRDVPQPAPPPPSTQPPRDFRPRYGGEEVSYRGAPRDAQPADVGGMGFGGVAGGGRIDVSGAAPTGFAVPQPPQLSLPDWYWRMKRFGAPSAAALTQGGGGGGGIPLSGGGGYSTSGSGGFPTGT